MQSLGCSIYLKGTSEIRDGGRSENMGGASSNIGGRGGGHNLG